MKKYADRLKVKLISYTKDPLPTLVHVWWHAKSDKAVPSIEVIKEKMRKNKAYREKVESLCYEIIDMLIPCSRFINFIFSFENVTVSWREQLVRHKTGFEYWVQGARVTDQSKFYDKGMYRIPDSIAENKKISVKFKKHMKSTQSLYKALKNAGFKFEDIREIMPAGAFHRLSLVCNIESLYNLIKKRTCWLLQGELWMPIIDGMISELSGEISPIFENFVLPPCLEGQEQSFVKCKFRELALDRYSGKTSLPCCPIFYFKERAYIHEKTGKSFKSIGYLKKRNLWSEEMIKQYHKFWRFNPLNLKNKG